MAQEPKKRHSRARQGKRRAAISLVIPKAITCPNCGAPHVSHHICKNCGFYKGEQIITVKQRNTSTSATS